MHLKYKQVHAHGYFIQSQMQTPSKRYSHQLEKPTSDWYKIHIN